MLQTHHHQLSNSYRNNNSKLKQKSTTIFIKLVQICKNYAVWHKKLIKFILHP